MKLGWQRLVIVIALISIGQVGLAEPIQMTVSGPDEACVCTIVRVCACGIRDLDPTSIGLDDDAIISITASEGWTRDLYHPWCDCQESFSKTFDAPGTYECTITVDDANCWHTEKDGPASFTHYITVKDHWDRAPGMSVGEIQADTTMVARGGQIHLDIEASDQDTKNCGLVDGTVECGWSAVAVRDGRSAGVFSPWYGSSTTWTAPQDTGEYRIYCNAVNRDGGVPDACTGSSRDDGTVVRTLSVYVVPALLKPLMSDTVPPPPPLPRPPPPPGFPVRDAIMTGGVFSAAHQTTITAKVEPAVSGSVLFEIVGWASTGVNHHAMLSVYPGGPGVPSMSVPLDGSGQAQAILTSSDKDMEAITVRATFEGQTSYIYIPQATGDYPRPDGFVCDPEMLPVDNQSTTTIRFKLMQVGLGVPVPGHRIHFFIDSICDMNGDPIKDANGNPIQGPNWPSEYGSITQPDGVTGSDGIALGTYKVGSIPACIYITAEDIDD